MAIKPKNFEKSRFLKPQTRKGLRKELRAALRLTSGKAKRQVGQDIRSSRVAQKRNRAAFNTYGEQVDTAAQRTAGAYDKAQQGIQQTSGTAADFAETLRQRMASEAQADAQRRGVAYNPQGSYTAADANLARINSANVLSSVTGAQGASQASMFADKKRIGERESLEQALRERKRRESLRREKREIAGDDRATITQALAGGRDSDRDFYLGLLAAQEGPKNRQASRRESARGRRADRRSGARASKAERKDDKRERRRMKLQDKLSNKGDDKGGGASKKDRKRARALALADDKSKNPRQAYRRLIQQGVDPGLAKRIIRNIKKNQGGGKWGPITGWPN